MKYTEFTTVEHVLSSAKEDWESFKQDIVGQKAMIWLRDYIGRQDLSSELDLQLHSDWGGLYPCLSALRIFEALKHIDRNLAERFIDEFKTEHKLEIETEYKQFRSRNQFVDRMFGINDSISKPIVGFLLVSDGNKEYTVYIIYEGLNTYGSASIPNEACHQSIVTNESLLQSKHFSITASRLSGLTFKVLSGNSFRFESNPNFREGVLDYRSHLVLGELHLTFLQNFN